MHVQVFYLYPAAANLGYNLFVVKGLRAAPREMFLTTLRQESVKQLATVAGSEHSPRVCWISTLVKRLDEFCQLRRDCCGRAAGRIDHRQAELPVFAPVADSVRQALRIGVVAKAPLSLLVCAVQQHPRIDRPVVEFIGRAHARQHDWQVCHRADNCVNEFAVGGPGLGIVRYLPPGQGGGGSHERIPVQDSVAR